MNPLLVPGDKRAIKFKRNAAVKEQFGGKIHRRRRAIRQGFGGGQDSGGDRVRQTPAQRLQREPDGIPAQIAKAPGGFKRAVHTDVATKKLLA